MFCMTGQNRTSSRRSSASLASQRLGPRGDGGGGKNSACGTLALVLNIHAWNNPIHAVDPDRNPFRPRPRRRGILRTRPIRGRSTPRVEILLVQIPRFAAFRIADQSLSS